MSASLHRRRSAMRRREASRQRAARASRARASAAAIGLPGGAGGAGRGVGRCVGARVEALLRGAHSGRAPARPAPRSQASQPVRSPLAPTSAMQSTGQTGTHSSQPVQSSSIDDVHPLGRADDRVDRARLQAERAADAPGLVDHARARAAPSLPQLGSRGRAGRPVSRARRSMPSAPPGGQRLIVGGAGGDRLGVAAAVGVAAAAALRLRQRRRAPPRARVAGHGRPLRRLAPAARRLRRAALGRLSDVPASSGAAPLPPGGAAMKSRTLRIDLLAPAPAREDAVVAGADDVVVEAPVGGNAGAQVVRGLGLAGARDVVELAFDRQQRGRADVLRPHQLAARSSRCR